MRTDAYYDGCPLAALSPELLPALADAADYHHVLPLVWQALLDTGRCGALEHAEAACLDRLLASSITAAARHLQANAELARLAPLLDSCGAPWAAVKGPVLAQLAYPHPELRVYADLDVLVHPKAFGTVVQALEASGARLVNRDWLSLHRREQCELTLLLRYGTYLDLHWHLVNSSEARSKFRWDTQASLERCRRVAIGATHIPTLDPEDTLLHVALHGALSGGHRLSWAKDVERLVAVRDYDWDGVARRADAARIELPVGAMLQRSVRLLGAEVPRTALRQFAVPRVGALALRLGEHLATPRTLARGHHTGQLLMLTARTGVPSSAAAIGRELRRKVGSGTARSDAGQTRALEPDLAEDPSARRNYLDQVGACGEVTAPSRRTPRGRYP